MGQHGVSRERTEDTPPIRGKTKDRKQNKQHRPIIEKRQNKRSDANIHQLPRIHDCFPVRIIKNGVCLS